jgi:hypothetical protein
MKFQPGQSGNPAERGENPFPDDPVKSAYVMNGEGLYRQMTEDGCQRTDFDGAASGLVSSDLYSPVNSEHAAEEESSKAPSSYAVSEAAEVSGFPLPPRRGPFGRVGVGINRKIQAVCLSDPSAVCGRG